MPPVVVTAFRIPQAPFELARSVTYLDEKDLARRDKASVLDSLNLSTGIWIEKRTATTSEPVVRGPSVADRLTLIDWNPTRTSRR